MLIILSVYSETSSESIFSRFASALKKTGTIASSLCCVTFLNKSVKLVSFD